MILLILAGLKIYLLLTPVGGLENYLPGNLVLDPNTEAGKIFDSAADCAYRQKGLFGYIEAFRKKYDRVPESIEELLNDDMRCSYYTRCPLGPSYVIHPENYGNPDGVFISESSNKHNNTLSFWLRGISPSVQTMGNGIIYLFKDGKIATVDARKK